MKKLIFIIVLAIILASCTKTDLKDVGSFTNEVATEEAQLVLSESGYTINSTASGLTADGYFTSGSIEYKKNNNMLATIDFDNGEHTKATISKGGAQTKCNLKKDAAKYKGKKSAYKKVIVEPLVKTSDCSYITSGIIKYYDIKSGKWTATIKYGDGTCDSKAVKTTKEGDYTFSLDDWK